MQLGSDSPGRRRRVFVFVVNGGDPHSKNQPKRKTVPNIFGVKEHKKRVPKKQFRLKQIIFSRTKTRAKNLTRKHKSEVKRYREFKMKNQTPSRKVKRYYFMLQFDFERDNPGYFSGWMQFCKSIPIR